jgi:hypothetical protein
MWGTILPIFTNCFTFCSCADGAQGDLREDAIHHLVQLNHTFPGQPHRNAIRTLEHIYAFHEFNMSCPRTCYWSGMKRRDSVVVAEIILVPTNFTYSLSNRARCFVKQTNLEHTLFCMSDLTIQILEHKLLQLLRCKKCRLQLGFRMHNLGIAGIHDSAVPTLASAREAG